MHEDSESIAFARKLDCSDEARDTRQSLEEVYQKPEIPCRVWPKSESSSCGTTLLRLVVFAFALWGFVDTFVHAVRSFRSRLRTETPHCWCGTTDEQAIAVGCHYDHIAVDWLPDSCIDRDLVVEFDTSGPGPNGSWPYFDMEDSTEVGGSSKFVPMDSTDIDDFAKTGKLYWATREWHILHCMFTWRKQFRARFDAANVEPWNNNEEHIQHCSDYIMRTVTWGLSKDVVDTQILGVNRHTRETQE